MASHDWNGNGKNETGEVSDKERNFEFKGENISIRRMVEADKENFLKLCYSNKEIAKDNDIIEWYTKTLWGLYMNVNTLTCLIKINATNEIIGQCQLEYIDTKTPNVAIKIVEEHRNKGYGYEAVRLLLENAHLVCDAEYFEWKCFDNNTASQKLVKKLNGVFVDKKSILSEEMLEKLKEINTIKDPEDMLLAEQYRIYKDKI